MWKKKFFDGSELGLQGPFSFLNLSSAILPRLDMMGEIRTSSGALRASLQPTGRNGGGGHSYLEENWRIESAGQKLVLLKKPKDESISLRTEAFIQWISHKVFTENKLSERIPKICDILELPDKCEGFTMCEIMNSKLCSSFLATSTNLQTHLFHVLIQTAILLQILEDTLALDHRDLKADNLLITNVPSTLTFYMISQKCHYTVISPFTVCIVDFGFACLGDPDTGLTAVDAGEGTLPPLDPCPKDGRDLYHLLISLYAQDSIYRRLSPELDSLFKSWMEIHGRATDTMARRWSHSEWLYLITSRKEFTHPSCTSKAIIEKIMSLEPGLFLAC